ncbi:DUF58 domain-containing protein [Alkalimarinus alittae]|uniref:DUF58 domain-containing protein n=1 Tax=Alkalimarinus alittae TaxID=2961619 RepID=A0ABY6N632_9ALTE|nr:DUF58 domain-containing protein [Alkalimarinus alittae]UZE97580.1 DUF58 domain-containing protein [Alkalimarinus alittae]
MFLFNRTNQTTANRSNSNKQNQPSKTGSVYCDVKSLMLLRFEAMSLSMPSARRAVRQQAGAHRSPFRGRGMEFSEVRLYQPGDDVRSIDWRVTARRQKPHTKLFHEERERPILIICDQSISQFFGSKTTFKSVRAAQSAALLAWMAIEKGDRVGGIVFSDSGHQEIKPARSRKAVMRFINVLADFNQALSIKSPNSNNQSFTLNDALLEAQRISKPGTLIFILSDFLDFNAVTEQHIQVLAKHNDVAAVRNYDELEMKLPPPGTYSVSDGSNTRTLDTQACSSQALYAEHIKAFNKHLRATMTRLGIPYIEQDTVEPTRDTVQKLMQFIN